MPIAFDASSLLTETTGASATFSHTTAGSNKILFVGVLILTSNDLLTGITYAGVAMTRVNTLSFSTTRRIYLYALHAPAAGANNVVVSFSSSTNSYCIASSYTGAKQTSTVDSQITNGFTTTGTLTTTTTTIDDNCWLIMMARTESGVPYMAAGSGTLLRQNNTNNSIAIFDSNGARTPAGSQSLQTTQPTDGSTGHCLASFAPFLEAGNPRRRLLIASM